MLAKRVAHLGPTGAFEFLKRAKELEAKGEEVIHLEIGSPDFDTPQQIKNEAIKWLNKGFTKYVQGQGIPELRRVIAKEIEETRKIKVTPEEVIVAPGASSIIFYTMLALVEEGDEVLYPDPGFFTYLPLIILTGGKPVPIHLIEEKGFSIDVEEIKSKLSNKTKLLIINFPHNPTGGMILEEDLQQLASLLKDREIYVLSDEVYSHMVYEGKFFSIASYPGMKKKTIIIDSYSKTHAMPGWRLGYGTMEKELLAKVVALLIQCNSCTTSFIQPAGIEALIGEAKDEIKKMVKIYKKRRDVMVKGLNSIPGIKCHSPRGAFYVFPNIKELQIPAKELALRLLYETKVACLPGTAFGKFGEGYLRFTYSAPEEKLKIAIERVKDFVKKL